MGDFYRRQKELNLNTDQSFTVVGCGGIGYWVCKFLAMAGVEKIYAYDHDVLEDHNLGRIDLPIKFVNRNKADVVKLVVNELRPDCAFYAMPWKYSEHNAEQSDWLIDCTDITKVQEENQRIAKEKGMKYFKVGYDGENFSIHNKVAEWGESTDGYTIVPSWVSPAVMAASMATAKVLKYPDAEMVTSIKGVFMARRIV